MANITLHHRFYALIKRRERELGRYVGFYTYYLFETACQSSRIEKKEMNIHEWVEK